MIRDKGGGFLGKPAPQSLVDWPDGRLHCPPTLDPPATAQVPDEVGRACPCLEELDLSNNELSSVTPYLSLLPSLRALKLEGNPLRTMRRAILDKGTPGVMLWLKDRMPI